MKNLRFNEILENGREFEEIVNEIEQASGMDCDWDTTDRLSQSGYEYGHFFGRYMNEYGEKFEALLSEDEIRFIKK
jgi:hypothetical protein